nr:uncharacterized protein LOC117443525 [Pseudochaenichthys georgianus]
MAAVIAKKSSERWSDEDVSALLSIYSEDATQRLLLKAVSNAKLYDRCSLKLRDLGIFHSANSCRDDDDDDEEGAEMGQLFLETSELSPPDRDSSPRSSPFPPTKRKGKRARDESFLDTIAAMEDRRAMASKESEDRRAMASREMHDEQMLSVHKSQETDNNLVMVMLRQADAMSRQAEASARQAEVSAQQQQAFQVGLLAVLSELVKSNRPSSL